MQEKINMVVAWLQQGIAGIFRFVSSIINWYLDEINRFVNLPWGSLSWWKLVLAAAALGYIAYLTYQIVMHLWEGVEGTLKAFGKLLSTFVELLPKFLLGIIVMTVTLFIINKFNFTIPWKWPF